MNTEFAHQPLTGEEEYPCVEPEIGQYLHEYLAETLPEELKDRFERHLTFCLKCQEDIAYMDWVLRTLEHCGNHAPEAQLHTPSSSAPPLSGAHNLSISAQPLHVHAVYDVDHTDLTDYYHEKPLFNTLAAAIETTGVIFPLTIEYAHGQVVGQFWKRVSYLSYRLKKCEIEGQTSSCLLRYKPSTTPSEVTEFEIHAGQEILLGNYRELMPSDIPQDILRVIRRFELCVNNPDNLSTSGEREKS